MEIVIVWLLLAGGVGFLADSRGRSGFGFFLLSAVFSPLLGLIVVLVVSNLNEVAAQERQRIDEQTKERLRREEHERQLESIKAIATPQKASAIQQHSSGASSISIADEIRKLGALRSEGLLTDAEFQSQKLLLLASPSQKFSLSVEPESGAVSRVSSATTEKFGICPNCDSTIPLLSKDCPRCGADFTDGSNWSVKAISI